MRPSGLSVEEFARQRRLKPQRLRWWEGASGRSGPSALLHRDTSAAALLVWTPTFANRGGGPSRDGPHMGTVSVTQRMLAVSIAFLVSCSTTRYSTIGPTGPEDLARYALIIRPQADGKVTHEWVPLED